MVAGSPGMHYALFVSHDRYYKIVGSSENYSDILSRLREEGLNFEPDSGSELLPITTIEVCFPCVYFLPSPRIIL